MPDISIMWFRRDLRLADNPALFYACKAGGAVIPVYIHHGDDKDPWRTGAAGKVWLHHSLHALTADLALTGAPLILREGEPERVLQALIKETGANRVLWNRLYEPQAIKRDSGIKKRLKAEGIAVGTFNGALLNEPHEIGNKQGGPFKVFTPFWRYCQSKAPPSAPYPSVRKLKAFPGKLESETIDGLGLLPRLNWHHTISTNWRAGHAAAQKQLNRFVESAMEHYRERRDYPGDAGVSRLSPHLHFGELSARQIWRQIVGNEQAHGHLAPKAPAMAYLRQLYWREFAHHLLFHFPKTMDEPLYEKYSRFPWRENESHLRAWQQGKTGYPIVDAGMRELWHSGWMHNRVRMITASFLVKDLLIHWREGAQWFWDTLVDADLANNTLGWQWVAGCGADAAPYFRIFNPVRQSERFDAEGTYLRRWLPELARLDNAVIHKPWRASADVLAAAGITLGQTYPEPIVDHKVARERALQALREI